MSVNGTIVEAKMCTFTFESTHLIFNKCTICTHTTVQGPYLALVETKRITVYIIETAYASVGALLIPRVRGKVSFGYEPELVHEESEATHPDLPELNLILGT